MTQDRHTNRLSQELWVLSTMPTIIEQAKQVACLWKFNTTFNSLISLFHYSKYNFKLRDFLCYNNKSKLKRILKCSIEFQKALFKYVRTLISRILFGSLFPLFLSPIFFFRSIISDAQKLVIMRIFIKIRRII